MPESQRNPVRYEIEPIGYVRSSLKRREDAPHQGPEGAPAAWLELEERFADGLLGLEPGAELDVVTWLHLSERDILRVRPSHDPERRLRGVFATRAPVRPNPLGIHRVQVRAVEGTRLEVEPLEAVDGTPVVDIKAAFTHRDAD
jgi:tRNA-Thr(GGU) m(6)t(6)A37 methyltransferase TsaA